MPTRPHRASAAKRPPSRIALYLALAATLIPIMFPYYWMIAASLKTKLANIQSPQLLFAPTFENYERLFADPEIMGALANSAIVGVGSTLLALALGLPCAFALARLRLGFASTLILIARMIAGIALVLPWYIVYSRLDWIASYQALLLSHLTVTLPMVVWLAIGFFEDLPSELLDAAAVDGCAPRDVFIRIAIPLARTGIIAAALLAFIYSWNTFLYSLILGGSLELAPVVAYRAIQDMDPDWGAINAVAVVTTWPIILLSLPFAKYLVRGLTAGASKG